VGVFCEKRLDPNNKNIKLIMIDIFIDFSKTPILQNSPNPGLILLRNIAEPLNQGLACSKNNDKKNEIFLLQ
jgi:hypothetical protein